MENDDPFVVITPPDTNEQPYESQQSTEHSSIGPRSMVSNFFSGIRQRRWTMINDSQMPQDSLAKTNSFLNNLDLNLRNSISRKVS